MSAIPAWTLAERSRALAVEQSIAIASTLTFAPITGVNTAARTLTCSTLRAIPYSRQLTPVVGDIAWLLVGDGRAVCIGLT